MSTKIRQKIKNKWKKRDPFNIKNITLFYFILFAGTILLLIWCLQGVFMNRYYEQMTIQEAQSAANQLERYYEDENKDFNRLALLTSVNNGMYIRLEDKGEVSIFDDGSYSNVSNGTYLFEITEARQRLESSRVGKISLRITDKHSDSLRLVYATYINDSRDAILYMITPLTPVKSTITILRLQLLYISFIALFIATMLAFIISSWLTFPLESITRSAEELSNGNYNVKFSGGMFTETKKLARTLNKASYEMQKTDSYQRDLLANVSHDLKTPLTMIRAYAEMIQDISGDDPEKRNEHLNVIISEADRLNKLVTDMLSVSKLQSNTATINKETFDLNKAAEEVEATYEVLNQSEGYHITFTKSKPAFVYGDFDKIKQVMANLISNAVKYCGEDKVIQIKLTRTSRKIRFDVIDHGQGIAEDEISHVWDRYYRTSMNRNRQIEGTGLGLSIVKEILTIHNADYGVESKEGKGSDFWFEMDIVKKDAVRS